jgi:hypothetical protein
MINRVKYRFYFTYILTGKWMLAFTMSQQCHWSLKGTVLCYKSWVLWLEQSMGLVKVAQAEKQERFDFKYSQSESPRIPQSFRSHVFRTSLLPFQHSERRIDLKMDLF